MKVLIIDDEEDTRSIASMSLSILGGVDVGEAEGGMEGIAKAEVDRPDVILLDMMMPVMDGIATLGELQKNPRTNDIPVIFLTAKAMSTEIDRLIRMGAIAVLTKPFDPTTLANQVENILQTRGLKVTPNAVSNDNLQNVNPELNAPPGPTTNAPANNNFNAGLNSGGINTSTSNISALNNSNSNMQPMAPPAMQSQTYQAQSQSQYQTGSYAQAQQQNSYNNQINKQYPYQQPQHNMGQANQQQLSQNYTEPTQQQRIAQQSVTSDYVVPVKPTVYLRTAQQDAQIRSSQQPANSSQIESQGFGQTNQQSNQHSNQHSNQLSNQQPNGSYNSQPDNQSSQNGSQSTPAAQPWLHHQPPQPSYDGHQQWSPQPLTSQNLDPASSRPVYNEQNHLQPPQMMPEQNGGRHDAITYNNNNNNNNQISYLNPDQDNRPGQNISGQNPPSQPKRLTIEEIRFQQTRTDGYAIPDHGRHVPAQPPANGVSNGSGNSASTPKPVDKSGDNDPWVAAANANVQSTSAKFIVPKLNPPAAEKPVSSKPVKPRVEKAPEEPRQKKFAHPWGPAKAPNWSQSTDESSDDDPERDDDERSH